jgi:hypothetical protein
MRINYFISRFLLISVFISLLLAGCSSISQRPSQSVSYPLENQHMVNPAWRSCFFKIHWPEDSDLKFELDLLLAHRIVAPVLKQYGDSLYRWRFHRRANRDDAGHQFSFIFYSGADVAAQISQQINQSRIKQRLIDEDILETTRCTSSDDVKQKQIGDTSDGSWPESVQRHWPTYIMGVSMTWLSLVDDVVPQSVNDEMDIDSMIVAYGDAEEQVNELWAEYGQHAFLHHLNAVFGYESLLIRY